jgi:hypothetical protein
MDRRLINSFEFRKVALFFNDTVFVTMMAIDIRAIFLFILQLG